MAQSIKYSLYYHKELRSDSQHLFLKTRCGTHLWPHCSEHKGWRIPLALWLASLAKSLSSTFSKRSCSENKVKSNWGSHVTLSSGLHTHTWGPLYLHTRTTQIKTKRSEFQHGGGRGSRSPTLADDLVTINGYWDRKSPFSLKVWPVFTWYTQWLAPHPWIYGQHKLDLVDYLK